VKDAPITFYGNKVDSAGGFITKLPLSRFLKQDGRPNGLFFEQNSN